MKITFVLLGFCLLSATAAFGQYSSAVYTPSMTTIYSPPNHPEHAMYQSLADEHDLRGGTSVTIGQGEMPLWEVPLESHEVPLGDSARKLRAEHDIAKKAQRVVSN